MAYGFYCLNNGLAVQIDGEHPHYALINKGSITGISPQVGVQRFSLTLSTVFNPMLAIRAENCNASLEFVINNNNGTHTFNLFCVTSDAGAVIKWFLFDKPNYTARTSGYGIEIRNAANQIVFSDEYPPLKILTVEQFRYVIDYETRTYPVGKTYAQITDCGMWRNRIVEIGDSLLGPPIYARIYNMGGFRWSANILQTRIVQTDDYHGFRAGDETEGGPSMLVAEITNL